MIYAAGLVALFSRYPSHLVARAIDPVDGLPSLYNFSPTMKEVKDYLEPLFQHECRLAESERRRNQQILPAPPRDDAADKRIAEGFKKLGDTLRAGATR
jgi:hypothetical protein